MSRRTGKCIKCGKKFEPIHVKGLVAASPIHGCATIAEHVMRQAAFILERRAKRLREDKP